MTRRSVSFIQTKMLVRGTLCVLVLPPQSQLHSYPSLKPGSSEDHPSLAARFKPSWATREQSSSFYSLQRRRNTPNQTHCGKVKQAKQSLSSQLCTTVDLDPGSGPVQTPTAHAAPKAVPCDSGAFLKHLALTLCKRHQCKQELCFGFKPVKLH